MRLIDADALAMHMADWQLSASSDQYSTIEEAIDAVVGAPTIDAVRHGRWVKVYGEHISMGHRPWAVCCSECDKYGDYTNYCPNCGAKMDKEEA